MGFFFVAAVVFHGDARADDLEKDVETVRGEVLKLMEGKRVADAEIEVSLPVSPLLQAITAINGLPVGLRTIVATSTGANGKFWEDGETWCNSFAELASPDGFKATAVLSNFGTTVLDKPTLAISADVSVDASANVHWQFMGRRVEASAFGVKIGGGICPPGGGVGGHIGATAKKTFRITGQLGLVQDPGSGVFRYEVALVDPPSVSMTLSLGFQHIGTLGIPQNFKLPMGVIASGELPLMIKNKGTVELPGGSKRDYSISLTPKRVSLNQATATGSWLGKVEIASPK